jgi:hypothetical protein
MRVLTVVALALAVGCGERPLGAGSGSLDGAPGPADGGLARDAGAPPADAGPADGVTPADGPAGWTCETDAAGNTTCAQAQPDLPGPSGWLCWDYGEETECAAAEPLEAGPGWACEPVAVHTRCRHARVVPAMAPPNGAWYCWFALDNRRLCSDAPYYGSHPQPPSPACLAGQRRWCDGAAYDGWGQQTCLPNGTWGPCYEKPASRPRTLCACFDFYLNPDCYELPSGIVPPGTDGQTCPASSGVLCDYCTSAGECQAGARCIYTNSGESFCGRDCTDAACPDQYDCRAVTDQGGQTYQQCVPASLTCYWRS